MHFTALATLCSLNIFAASAALTAYGPHPQEDERWGWIDQAVQAERAAAVKDAFDFAWNGYYEHAFPNDELLPASNGFSNSRGGWGASAVDALSTALVMEKYDVTTEILSYISTLDWSVTEGDSSVSLFETTIRYLGGILSGYDLLTGPLSSHVKEENSHLVPALLEQAVHLANNLSYAFNGPTGIPCDELWIGFQETSGCSTNGLAAIGTLVLEWTRLSDITGDPTYGLLAQTAEDYLLDPQPSWAQPWPGLLGSNVNINTGSFEDSFGGWNGGTDSFYEYLVKMYVYDPARFGRYKNHWIRAADSSIAHLASHPSTRPDLTYLAVFSDQTLLHDSSHLACFDGGNFILGGLVLKEQKYLDFGLELVDSCYNVYNQTVTGIGPELFSWNEETVPADQQEFFGRAGFYVTNSEYNLRPEIIESLYYAYRATGDPKYQDWAWNAFDAIRMHCQTTSGFSRIADVNSENGGAFYDFQESFLFAEVLKYAYLIQAEDAECHVSGGEIQQWVYSTEGHPLKTTAWKGSNGPG